MDPTIINPMDDVFHAHVVVSWSNHDHVFVVAHAHDVAYPRSDLTLQCYDDYSGVMLLYLLYAGRPLPKAPVPMHRLRRVSPFGSGDFQRISQRGKHQMQHRQLDCSSSESRR